MKLEAAITLRQSAKGAISAGGPGSGRRPGGDSDISTTLEQHGFSPKGKVPGGTVWHHPEGHSVVHQSGDSWSHRKWGETYPNGITVDHGAEALDTHLTSLGLGGKK